MVSLGPTRPSRFPLRVWVAFAGTRRALLQSGWIAAGLYAGMLAHALLLAFVMATPDVGPWFGRLVMVLPAMALVLGLGTDFYRFDTQTQETKFVLPRSAGVFLASFPAAVAVLSVARAVARGNTSPLELLWAGLVPGALAAGAPLVVSRFLGPLFGLGSRLHTGWQRRHWRRGWVSARDGERTQLSFTPQETCWVKAPQPIDAPEGDAYFLLSHAEPGRPPTVLAQESPSERAHRKHEIGLAYVELLSACVTCAALISPVLGWSLVEVGEPLPFTPPD